MKNFSKSAVFMISLFWIYAASAQTDPDMDLQAGKLPAAAAADCQEAIILDPAPTVHAKAQPGTYQFFILGNDSTQLQRADILERIERFRHETSVVHLKVSSTTTIRILPKKEITAADFKPLANEVIFQPDNRDFVQK